MDFESIVAPTTSASWSDAAPQAFGHEVQAVDRQAIDSQPVDVQDVAQDDGIIESGTFLQAIGPDSQITPSQDPEGVTDPSTSTNPSGVVLPAASNSGQAIPREFAKNMSLSSEQAEMRWRLAD